jgi:hypothetical protein
MTVENPEQILTAALALLVALPAFAVVLMTMLYGR